MKTAWCVAAALLATLGGASASAKEPPRLQRNGDTVQLMVDGAPYIVLGGELHNSSPSSPAYMAPIWDRLARNHVGAVIGAASWELVEPREGQYDFTAVDDQIRQAHAHGMRLVLIWFGAYKNAESRYAPSWVRGDKSRFPRAVRSAELKIPAQYVHYFNGPAVSVFSPALAVSDARAFAALMRHIRQVDADQTVIMIQVENETGLLGETRDRSALADAAWKRPVPPELIAYLQAHKGSLRAPVRAAWEKQGFRRAGTWAEVFGADPAGEEIFMAWSFGRYVDRIARAGAAEDPLPMYANAWIGPQPSSPVAGMYPTGGPVAGMLDVWKAAAPSIAVLAPDTYVEDFAGTMAAYRRADNPILIPETRLDVGNLFVALGQFDAIAFSPFGIDSAPDGDDVFKAYDVLNGMAPLIAKAQADGRIAGVKLGKDGAAQTVRLGDYDLTVSGPLDTRGAFGVGTGSAQSATKSHALILNTGPDEFLVVGQGINIAFRRGGVEAEVDSAQEGRFDGGVWTAGRTLNGDERSRLFPSDSLAIVRIKLLRP